MYSQREMELAFESLSSMSDNERSAEIAVFADLLNRNRYFRDEVANLHFPGEADWETVIGAAILPGVMVGVALEQFAHLRAAA